MSEEQYIVCIESLGIKENGQHTDKEEIFPWLPTNWFSISHLQLIQKKKRKKKQCK